MDKTRISSIVFFMLVTPRDVRIAEYTIRSFAKLNKVLFDYDWRLQVYLNCLSDIQRKDLLRRCGKLSYVEWIDNSCFVKGRQFNPGELVHFEGNSTRPYEGKYEIGCMVWEREFRVFTTDYWGIVDADFEILEPGFIKYALQLLDSDSHLFLFSTDHGVKQKIFNTYTNLWVWSMPRFDTWFCIYKRDCQICSTPLYYHDEIRDGEIFVWDDTGRFQEDLQKQTGCRFDSIDSITPIEERKKYQYQYIHYGAFSKNISINSRGEIFVFRLVNILSYRGFMAFNRNSFINKVVRKVFCFLRDSLYHQSVIERQTYHYE